jgi:hypothetical protein
MKHSAPPRDERKRRERPSGGPRDFHFITPEQAVEIYKDSPGCVPRSLKTWRKMAANKAACEVCGQPAWKYADTGMCFPCTTGESDASDDYELAGEAAMKYRKKPIVIEAQRLTPHNLEQVEEWCRGSIKGTALPRHDRCIDINTLEGEMRANIGDWVIRGIKGEFYPCKHDIFEASYEAVP